MRKLIATLFLLGAWSSAALGAEAAPPLVDFTLQNGLRVLLVSRPTSPSVAVQLFYHAGSKDEPETRRGIAHLFEHMMFKGSQRVPPEAHARYINQLGGDSNAFTTDDLTAYENTVPRAALDFTLALEADRMHGLKVTQALLDSEREVVKEELRMRFENSPVAEGVRRMISLAFTKHPYKMMAIGTKEMLDAVTVEDCRKFYDMFYRPNNATLVIVGAATEAEVRQLVAKHFDALPRGPTVTRRVVEEPPQTAPRSEVAQLQMALPLVIGAYHIPAAVHPDSYAIQVLNEILSEGESSRLHNRVVRAQLAVFAGGALFAMEEAGLFVTYAQLATNTPAAVNKARTTIEAEVARLTKEKVSPAELKKAKNKIATKALFERMRGAGLATDLGSSALMLGDPLATFREVERVDAVTADQVLAAAKKYLTANNRTSLDLIPRPSGAPLAEAPPAKKPAAAPAATPNDPKLAPLQPPQGLPAPQLQLGQVVRERLPNGMQLLVVPRHDVAVASVELMVPAGNFDAPIDRMGLAELTAGSLRKGAGKRSATQIAEAIESVGGSLSTAVENEHASLRISSRAGDVPLALELIADMSMRPTFPTRELEETLSEVLAEFVHDLRDAPGQLAMIHAANLFYGDLDPRGRPVSQRSIQNATRADLVGFHAERYRPDGAILVVSGDVDAQRIKALLARPGGLATWKSRGLLPRPAHPLPAPHPLAVRIVDKPEATQTSLVLAGAGIAHGSPELPALVCADYVLGGGSFSSRLQQVLRAEGGKTYDVSSSFTRDREAGMFSVTTNTRVVETGRTLKLMLDEIGKMQKNGPTATELEGARGNIMGRMSLALETARDVAGALAGAMADGLPDDYVEQFPARMRAVTLEQAKQAAKRFVPQSLVAVGPAGSVRPLLEQLGLKVTEVVPFDVAIAAADRTK